MRRLTVSIGLPIRAIALTTIALAVPLAFVFRPAGVVAIVVAGVLVTCWRTDIMLGLLAMSVPLQSSLVVHVEGTSITLTKLAVACLLLGWLPRAARVRVPLDRVTWGYASVLVALCGSIVAANDGMQWASVVYQWTVAVCVYLVARTELRSIENVAVILGSMAVAVLGVSAYGIFQVVTEDGPPSFFVNGVLRAYGTFGEPNPLAAYLEMTLPLLLAVLTCVFVSGRHIPPGTVATVGLVLASVTAGTVTLLLTQSRGGLLGFAVAVLIIASTMPVRWRFVCFGLGVCACLVLLQTPVGGGWWTRAMEAIGSFQGRVHVTQGNWATEERRAHWGAATRMLRENPFSGLGAGDFGAEFRQYTPDWRFRQSRGHAHNGYLQLAAESGIPGLVSFVAWCGVTVSALTGGMSSSRSAVERMLAVGSMATFVAFMVHSMVDYLNVLSLGIQIALVIAIGMARFPEGHLESEGRGLNVGNQLATRYP